MAMLTRYDPFREMVSLRDVMNRLFQEAMVAPGMMLGEMGGGAAPMDVRETEDAYEVHVSLPGWTPEEISVTIQQDTVTISGQRAAQEPAEGESGKKGHTYHVRERRFASFNRSFTFPTPIDAERVEARFENGELILRLPKSESARPRKIKIGGGRQEQLTSGGRSAGRQSGDGQKQSAPGQAASNQSGEGQKQSPSGQAASKQSGEPQKQPAGAGSSR